MGLFKICLVLVTSITISHCKQWWDYPCTTDPIPIRHARSIDLTIKYQIKIFNNYVKLDLHNLSLLYRNIQPTTINQHQLTLRWLNVKKMVNITKNGPQEQVLNEFYGFLQHFAVSAEVLRNIPINVTIKENTYFAPSRRRKIYDDVIFQIRALLCEIHDVIEEAPKIISQEKFQNNLFSKHKLPRSLDERSSRVLDFNFFKKLRAFMRRTYNQKLKRENFDF